MEAKKKKMSIQSYWNVTSAQKHVLEKSNDIFVCNHNTMNTKKINDLSKKATKRSVNILLMNK